MASCDLPLHAELVQETERGGSLPVVAFDERFVGLGARAQEYELVHEGSEPLLEPHGLRHHLTLDLMPAR